MPKPATIGRPLGWASRIVAWALPPCALLILVTGNVLDWRNANQLAGALAREESADHARRLTQALDDVLHERANDLALLAMLWRAPITEQRDDLFLREAATLMAREPLYLIVNFVDNTGVIRLSAPIEQSAAVVGLNVREQPDRDAWHAHVLSSGDPFCSEPITLQNGLPGLLIWNPVYESATAEEKPAGLLAGVIGLDALLERVLHLPNATDYGVSVFCGDKAVISPPAGGSGAGRLAADLGGTAALSILGRDWRVQTIPDASAVFSRLFHQNTSRFLLDLLVSALVFVLLTTTTIAVVRLRRNRRTLRGSEERLQLAMEAARDAIWEWHIPSGAYACDLCFRPTGLPPESIAPTFEFWQSLIHPGDIDHVRDTIKEHLERRTPYYECEYRIAAEGAEPTWVLDRGKVVTRDSSGAPIRMMGTRRDITAQKEVENALRSSRERYTMAIGAGKVGVWDCHLDSETFYADELKQLLGYRPEDLDDNIATWLHLVPPEDREKILHLIRAHLAGHTQRYECEHRMIRKDGSPAWLFCAGSIIERKGGHPARLAGTSTDITDLKNTEAALRTSEELYRLLAENSTDLITRHMPDGTYLYVSPAIRRLAGFQPEDLLGHTAFEYVHPDDAGILLQASLRALGGEQTTSATFRRRKKDGTYYWAETTGTVIRDPDTGKVSDIICVTRDVTERVKAEHALRQSEERLDLAVRGAGLGPWEWRIDTRSMVYSEGWTQLLGYSLEELGNDSESFAGLVHPDDRVRLTEAYDDYATGRAAFFEAEHRLRAKDGTWKWVFVRGRALQRDGQGLPVRMSGVIQDISKRIDAEVAFRRESVRAQHYLDIAGVMIVALDTAGAVTMINKKGCALLEYTEEELLGRNWFDTCMPESHRSASHRAATGMLNGEAAVHEYSENPVLTKSGQERLVAWHSTVLHDEQGAIAGLLFSGEDITERRRAEQAAKEREQQLIQADKMASLGVLVSGVAHEVNNPNAFVMNNMDLIEMVWTGAVPVLDRYLRQNGEFRLAGMDYSRIRERMPLLLTGIRDGARRIKLIVEELRGFARQEPDGIIESVNLNHVVDSAVTLLANMLKKSTDHFTFEPAAGLPPVQGSFRRLEQVVVNLLQNACQALTSRKEPVRTATSHDPATHSVTLIVQDGGAGISEDVLPRITDPFFTTKRDTGGTGLGLSISATIVHQHGGSLRFMSEPGAGTTVTVELPVLQLVRGETS